MSFQCDKTWCDNNTYFTKECMYGENENLIEHAKSGKPMCEHLRRMVLSGLKEEVKQHDC